MNGHLHCKDYLHTIKKSIFCPYKSNNSSLNTTSETLSGQAMVEIYLLSSHMVDFLVFRNIIRII